MKTINIKGKEYVTVNERLKEFREQYPDFALTTTIVQLDEMSCTMQATILDESGRVLAMGTAREERDDKASMVNKTSYVENCETSAWGRALGNFGIGIDESVASADEVARAIAKQERNAVYEMIDRPAKPPTNTPQTLDEELKTYRWQKGKHTGKLIYETDKDYLEWYIEKGFDEHVKDLCKLAIKKWEEDFQDLQPVDTPEEGLPF